MLICNQINFEIKFVLLNDLGLGWKCLQLMLSIAIVNNCLKKMRRLAGMLSFLSSPSSVRSSRE
jgi:hypothetical protein